MKTQPKRALSLPRLTHLFVTIVGALGLFSVPAAKAEGAIEFDVESLRSQGLDPKLANLFPTAPRFLAGKSLVELKVNGNGRGRIELMFNEQGQPCPDAEFIKKAGLKAPQQTQDARQCIDLKNLWPQMEWTLNPGEGKVELVVPQEALASQDQDTGSWQHGGVAGLVNYDAQYSGSRGGTSGLEFMQLASEAGFNAGDWIVRSRQTLSRFNGTDSFRHDSAYAQRTFAGLKKVLQAGQISLGNSMFGGGQVLGVQVFPEQALQADNGGPALVEGIADSQSVVEVRQQGVLVYSTTVPAGPFSLQGFQLLNTRNDLEVTLNGLDGGRRQFIVPAATLLLNGHAIAPGLSFGVGKIQNQGSGDAPVVGTLATGWVLTPQTTLNGGVFGSDPWRALAASLDSQVWNQTLLSLQLTGAQDERHNSQGLQASFTVSQPITERLSANANFSRQSFGYRELGDALTREDQDKSGYTREQYGLGLGWSQEVIGSLSFSWARSSTFDNDVINYLRASWSKGFGRSYVGLSLEQDSGGRNSRGDKRAYLSVSIPFGSGQSVNSYLSTSERSARSGLRYSNRTSQDRGWSLSADRDLRNRRSSATASGDLVTSVSQLSGSVGTDSDRYTSYLARASGSLVVHGGGITPSAYRVGDTFGIAKVGKEKGIRIETPGGPTWTDGRGYAVLPSLSGYKRSTVEVDTRSLPKNVDIANAWNETEAARGSVSQIAFNVVRTRRVLATVMDAQGKPLPYGASVFAESGDFVTVVGENGGVFISDADSAGKMDVQSSGKTLCSFRLALPEQPAQAELYETARASCK